MHITSSSGLTYLEPSLVEDCSMSGRRRLKSIEVRAIAPEKYPQFRKDQEHLYMHLEEGARKKVAVEIFAHVHAQQALEREPAVKDRAKKAD